MGTTTPSATQLTLDLKSRRVRTDSGGSNGSKSRTPHSSPHVLTYKKGNRSGEKAKPAAVNVTDIDSPSSALSCRSLLNPDKCPCNMKSPSSWQIDCSKCGQFWHTDCLKLNGLKQNDYNKLVDFQCPFCFVAPVSTTEFIDDTSCMSCRNTKVLRDANSDFEACTAAQNLRNTQTLVKSLAAIDVEKLTTSLELVRDMDSHLQHLLINDQGLEKFKSLPDKIASAIEPKLQQSVSSDSIDTLSEKIQHLEEQVSSLVSRPMTGPSTDTSATDKLLEDISKQLTELSERPPVDSSAVSEPSHPPPPTHPVSKGGCQFSHKEKPVAWSKDDFIDSPMEEELTACLESFKDQFKAEGGRLCLSFGEQYRYAGSQSSSSPQTIPPVLQKLIDKVNSELCLDGAPQMNSCLVNYFNGQDSSLPEHSDDERSIHPESSIHTVSLGSSCTVSFAAKHSDERYEHPCKSRSIYSMTRRSQEFYKHHIDSGSISCDGPRYSITLRSVNFRNRNATCIIGDSNTGGLKFGTDSKKSFGQWLPGKQFYAPVISQIDPCVSSGYTNVVLHCGINDLKKDSVKNLADIRCIFDSYVNKIECIQAVNPRAHVYVCPPLPTKRADLNKKSIYFNRLICTELLPSNFGVTFVDGFDGFLDGAGLLNQQLSRNVDKNQRPDYLHLNWRGVAKLGVLIRNTVLLRMNGGHDRRKRSPTRAGEQSYRDVLMRGGHAAAAAAGSGSGHHDGYQPW